MVYVVGVELFLGVTEEFYCLVVELLVFKFLKLVETYVLIGYGFSKTFNFRFLHRLFLHLLHLGHSGLHLILLILQLLFDTTL